MIKQLSSAPMAALILKYMLVCFSLAILFSTSQAETCSNHTFPSNKVYSSCRQLPYLQAYLHWNYRESDNIIEIAYRAAQKSTGWIAWGINPTATGMVGSQAIVAFHNSNGSMNAYPTQLSSYNPSMKPVKKNLIFRVSNISAEYSNSKSEMTIFAVVGPFLDNVTAINHVWQAGNSVADNIPQMHSATGPNILSTGTIDFLSV